MQLLKVESVEILVGSSFKYEFFCCFKNYLQAIFQVNSSELPSTV